MNLSPCLPVPLSPCPLVSLSFAASPRLHCEKWPLARVIRPPRSVSAVERYRHTVAQFTQDQELLA
jgi:hypothetical protein